MTRQHLGPIQKLLSCKARRVPERSLRAVNEHRKRRGNAADGEFLGRTLLIVNEYRDQEGPVAALVSDLERELSQTTGIRCSYFARRGKYVPGGLRKERLLNFTLLHCCLPFYLFYWALSCRLRGESAAVMTTTSPPLIHWTSLLTARLMKVPCCVWFLDAHPELEARWLDKRGLRSLARLLRTFDTLIMRCATHLITLDNAMLQTLRPRLSTACVTGIIPPWKTYLHPPRSLRIPNNNPQLRLLYAGNLGAAHSLRELFDLLCSLPYEAQRGISLHFVGMGEDVFNRISSTYQEFAGNLAYRQRYARLDDLLNYFREFDFGIVSLDSTYGGLVCPSKAYSYLSQGLPILFSGPPASLAGQLCLAGWGYQASRATLRDLGKRDFSHLKQQQGNIFSDPYGRAITEFKAILQNMFNYEGSILWKRSKSIIE